MLSNNVYYLLKANYEAVNKMKIRNFPNLSLVFIPNFLALDFFLNFVGFDFCHNFFDSNIHNLKKYLNNIIDCRLMHNICEFQSFVWSILHLNWVNSLFVYYFYTFRCTRLRVFIILFVAFLRIWPKNNFINKTCKGWKENKNEIMYSW